MPAKIRNRASVILFSLSFCLKRLRCNSGRSLSLRKSYAAQPIHYPSTQSASAAHRASEGFADRLVKPPDRCVVVRKSLPGFQLLVVVTTRQLLLPEDIDTVTPRELVVVVTPFLRVRLNQLVNMPPSYLYSSLNFVTRPRRCFENHAAFNAKSARSFPSILISKACRFPQPRRHVQCEGSNVETEGPPWWVGFEDQRYREILCMIAP